MFKTPFSFEGRIRRTEYGLSYIIYIISAGIINVLMDINDATAFLGLGFIPLFWFFIAQGAKRCHDRGNSGWFQLIPFYVFWMLFADSDFGQNKYGPNPKGLGNIDEIDELGQHLVG
jgi:uncharacterized membrane protein YhaH (DUF805 family)